MPTNRHAAEAPAALVIAFIATIAIGTAALVVAALIADDAEAYQVESVSRTGQILPGVASIFPDRA